MSYFCAVPYERLGIRNLLIIVTRISRFYWTDHLLPLHVRRDGQLVWAKVARNARNRSRRERGPRSKCLYQPKTRHRMVLQRYLEGMESRTSRGCLLRSSLQFFCCPFRHEPCCDSNVHVAIHGVWNVSVYITTTIASASQLSCPPSPLTTSRKALSQQYAGTQISPRGSENKSKRSAYPIFADRPESLVL